MWELDSDAIRGRLVAVLDEAMQGATADATYFVDNRPDSGLFGVLAGLTAAEASREILGSSIAAQVHHVSFAMNASTGWIAGDRLQRDWSESWRVASVDDAAWADLLDTLRTEYAKLRSAIQSDALISEEALGEAVGAIAHVSYHLGSIWQKRRALGER